MAKKYYLDDHGLVTYNNIIKEKIAELVGFEVKIVDSLPLTGEEHILYLVPNAQDPNIHDEYLWVDEKWEMIGNTTINLDDYYTKEEIDSSIDKLDSSISALEIWKNDNTFVNKVTGETAITGADTAFVYVASNPTSGLVSLTSGVVLAANNYGSTPATGLTTDAYVQDLLELEIIE